VHATSTKAKLPGAGLQIGQRLVHTKTGKDKTSETQTPSSDTVIDSEKELSAFISTIKPSDSLYLDLEGYNLCRHGTIDIVTILVHPSKAVKLIDVHILGRLAFTTPSPEGRTLQDVFEDPSLPKLLWDVRNDADALWAHYGVDLAGVTDVQLLENASQSGDRLRIRGLQSCINFDLQMLSVEERKRWRQSKVQGKQAMGLRVFAQRPIPSMILQYCVNDVLHLPALRKIYLAKLNREWRQKVADESAKRVEEVKSPNYLPMGPEKRLGPWGPKVGETVGGLDANSSLAVD
jgi:exonuclease 3'-5' domain-containing protein 1